MRYQRTTETTSVESTGQISVSQIRNNISANTADGAKALKPPTKLLLPAHLLLVEATTPSKGDWPWDHVAENLRASVLSLLR